MSSHSIPPTLSRWTLRQTCAQFAAIAWLRWRMLVNNMRRSGRVGDIVAIVIVTPIFALIALALAGAVGFGGYEFTAHRDLNRITWLLWGTFLICQFLNINVGQPGTLFDPTQLIRFPAS